MTVSPTVPFFNFLLIQLPTLLFHFICAVIDDDVSKEKVCTLSSDLMLMTFSNQAESGQSINTSAGCERKLVTSCDSSVPLEIRVDFFENDFASTKVAIFYDEELVIIDENMMITPSNVFNSDFTYDLGTSSVTIVPHSVIITRSATKLAITVGDLDLDLAGLCGNLNQQLIYPDCSDIYDQTQPIEVFLHSYKLKPSDQVLRGERKECGKYN